MQSVAVKALLSIQLPLTLILMHGLRRRRGRRRSRCFHGDMVHFRSFRNSMRGASWCGKSIITPSLVTRPTCCVLLGYMLLHEIQFQSLFAVVAKAYDCSLHRALASKPCCCRHCVLHNA